MTTDRIKLGIKTVVEWTLNTLSIVALILVAAMLRSHFSPKAAAHPEPPALANVLPNENWASNGVTLVMALSVNCHWCTASAPFYRELLATNRGPAFHTIAIFPQSVSLGQEYTRLLEITVKDIRQANLQQLGIEATPALLVVDASGRIRSRWVGKLAPEEEDSVRKELSSVAAPQPGMKNLTQQDDLITANDLRQLLRSEPTLPVIDIRPRSLYRARHIAEALNIPQDELEIRAIHEVPKESTVVLYCHYYPPCESHAKERGVATYCTVGARQLHRNGFSKIKILKEDLAVLQSAGVRLSSLQRNTGHD
jgi:rhodanese-related sulfurtransferase